MGSSIRYFLFFNIKKHGKRIKDKLIILLFYLILDIFITIFKYQENFIILSNLKNIIYNSP